MSQLNLKNLRETGVSSDIDIVEKYGKGFEVYSIPTKPIDKSLVEEAIEYADTNNIALEVVMLVSMYEAMVPVNDGYDSDPEYMRILTDSGKEQRQADIDYYVSKGFEHVIANCYIRYPKVKSSPRSMANQFFDANLRAEQIIHIPTMCWNEDGWASEVEDAFDQDFSEIFEALGLEEPEDSSSEFLAAYFIDSDVTGFLVCFATPVPRNIDEHGDYMFSWGYYTNKWIHAETYDEACVKALAWRNQYIKEQTEKS